MQYIEELVTKIQREYMPILIHIQYRQSFEFRFFKNEEMKL